MRGNHRESLGRLSGPKEGRNNALEQIGIRPWAQTDGESREAQLPEKGQRQGLRPRLRERASPIGLSRPRMVRDKSLGRPDKKLETQSSVQSLD